MEGEFTKKCKKCLHNEHNFGYYYWTCKCEERNVWIKKKLKENWDTIESKREIEPMF